ncbi:MAG: Arginyl-tRNA synthetase [uncultured Thermomicrobiales bacterium]|uniref:arginine--tRNA ligase n=1 Tax=uncultured Thermomicrobiales bacterium TaxID=1645740 RepID=A0A6J4URN0_9BACT|nr:MAG: Arginyl-tRNA synthetase [uncultured Thermomicrobiales bacterium]
MSDGSPATPGLADAATATATTPATAPATAGGSDRTGDPGNGRRNGLPVAGAGIIAREERQTVEAITAALAELGLAPPRPLDLRPIPFAGTWGAATSVCRALASDLVARDLDAAGETDGLSKKEIKRRVNEAVPARSQQLAEQVAAGILAQPERRFAAVEAVNGYVNISFDANAVAARLIGEVLSLGAGYGRGEARPERVMIEHSQLNTHKAAHVGHLRNICLGVALTKIIDAAGYRTMPVTYIGDIGMHVVKCLWCYERFHPGQEPEDPAARGRWLGEIYAESDRRLNFRKDVVAFVQLLSREDQVFVGAIDRLLKYLWRKNTDGEDIAYLLGRVIQAQELKPELFREDDVLPKFWPLLGDQLRDEVENQKPYVPVEGVPDPTTTPEERLETWQRLAADMDDWWYQVPAWQDEVKETFQRWERKDPDFVALWETTRRWSLDDLGRIFGEFGATFDHWFFESGAEEPGRAMVQDLLERGIAEISDGLPVVKIDQKLGLTTETYRTLPILRSDGTTLYATKDLALTRQKFDEFGVDRALWVVDLRQSLYFQQIKKILELAGYERAADAEYVGYEWVALPEGVISSRKGNVPLFADLERETLERAHAVIAEKNPDLPADDKERVARQVGLGAIQYAMLARDNTKVIVYDPEEALSFDGHAAPYVQYAHARACRILERAERTDEATAATLDGLDFGTLEPTELALLQAIAALPDEVQRAAAEFRPLVIASHVYDLAKRFNDFYHACPVLQSEEPTRTARLALVAATRRALANELGLLGIAAPEEM